MVEEKMVNKSSDHWLEQEGITWEPAVAGDDFYPHLPEEEFNLRIGRARELLGRTRS